MLSASVDEDSTLQWRLLPRHITITTSVTSQDTKRIKHWFFGQIDWNRVKIGYRAAVCEADA